ncbi:hypothetical protein GCM10009555_089950 [Acrocarpospora macrocephala]|uniref:Uncharacterized protein n=1 Tax=Acrocarpospora macrocephala TaxID=150177 RepID=A0A5M3WP17_9ACTN|nr:hypothetical protein [Acrocarpospora macrocephala]GES08971.1 hypothetical protein Amac_025670 [Acrocarpospora macrocephala]
MIVINGTWQRVAFCALLVIPMALVIILMTPAFVILPFSKAGRMFILALIGRLTSWARVVVPKKDG